MRSASRQGSVLYALLAMVGLMGGMARAEAGSQTEPESADVRGRVELDLKGAALDRLGPIVVYLEPEDGPVSFEPPSEKVTIAQRNARFSPPFRAVVRGQTVDMPNMDAIYHNVFSYSPPNEFDLGIYPAGDSREVVLEHAGVVKAYCSIHESMNATIFVSPTPWYSVVRPSGRFTIRDVPAGRYTLRTWCEKLPAEESVIVVTPGADTEVAVRLGFHSIYPASRSKRSQRSPGGKGRQ
jgi:plastocyanin